MLATQPTSVVAAVSYATPGAERSTTTCTSRSRANDVARYVQHTAFDLPDIPHGAPLRESIEVRCLVVLG